MTHSAAFRLPHKIWLPLVLAAVLAAPPAIAAQTGPDASADSADSAGQGRILLVLPFDNLTNPASSPASSAPQAPAPDQISKDQASNAVNPAGTVDWMSEAAPEILNARFTSAGFLPLTREDRLYALDHLGLPETFQPSRATALRIAQTLDANYVLIGSYRAESGTLTLKARILDVAKLHLSGEITQTGPIAQLIPLLNSLAWQLTRQLDPSFSVAEETFRAAGSTVRLDAFEQYIRGLTERDAVERLRHLKKATDLSPDFTAAWLATGKLDFDNQQFDQAAISFAKVTRSGNGSSPAALEAGFYRGLSLIFSGNYPRAEESFAAVARVLPLPEVVNDQAVALARRGKDAVALFRQAAVADPTDPDYHFNLAVSLHRHGDSAEALTELAQSLKLHANDSEAKVLQEAWQNAAGKAPAQPAPANPAGPANVAGGEPLESPEPLERIKRTYDGAAFREAALMLDQVESARLAALPGPQRAAKLAASAREKLDRGLLLEAEGGYQAALAADGNSAVAHAGLAQVRERAGDSESARKEALAAMTLQPNLDADLVLARLDLSADHLQAAREDIEAALKLDPNNRSAKDLRKAIDTRGDAHSADAKPAAATTTTAKP